MAFIVLSSCIGTSIGGIIGGPIQRFLAWQWFFWIMLIFGGVVQIIHLFMPESRSTILLDKEAKRRRKTGEDPNIYGPNELKTPRISLKEAGKVWLRPFEMFIREPIVLCLSLLSGFSDALIFTFVCKPTVQTQRVGLAYLTSIDETRSMTSTRQCRTQFVSWLVEPVPHFIF